MTSPEYLAVTVRNHPAKVTVVMLHRAECRRVGGGPSVPVTLAEYASGESFTRRSVPRSTGWEYGRNAAAGDPEAPAWLTGSELRLTCGHCMRGFRASRQ